MWYTDWFEREEYEIVYRQRDDREAETVIELLERTVRPQKGDDILDLACGRGRHARVLALRGYRVTGIDLSNRAVSQARGMARREGLDIRFEQGDMREPFGVACYDGVVNLFTAFGYFNDEADHGRVIHNVATALKPGGWLFQDFLNAPYVEKTLVPEDRRVDCEIEITQRRWIENGRVNKQIILGMHGEDYSFTESVRLLTLHDFRSMYEAAGFTLVTCLGDYDGSAYGEDSPRLILYAIKMT